MPKRKSPKFETITKIDFTLNSKLVETYSELIRKKDILKQIMDEFDLKGVTIEELKEKIEVTAETEGGLIKIEVTNSNIHSCSFCQGPSHWCKPYPRCHG